jgi:hypothetical protein
MAWTKKRDGSFITLIPDGSSNFVWTTEFPEQPDGVKVKEMRITFSAANDKIVIHTHRSDGAEILNFLTLDGTTVASLYHDALIKPIILHSEQTYGTPGNWRINIQTT